ncbi:DUF6734 family protein [Cryptosporangium sp. NPDC051539]|uniref:DUF6734 family protein n=1 Tax=Cryptosporangium sp. NPDC051539 TaxID=3363962 RepID=UPI00379B60B4
MRAFHAYSSKPPQKWFGTERTDGRCHFEDFEVLMTALSALEWRRHNGPITLYADDPCASYFEDRGLTGLWDHVDVDVLGKADVDTNFGAFWAFAKTVALAEEQAPCVALDMDLVVWKNLENLITADFMAIHTEPLDFQVYVPRDELRTPPGYVWDDLDWTVTPCNAALLYFGSEAVRADCAEMGRDFVADNDAGGLDLPTYAVFVEQRLYPMIAQRLGATVGHFLADHHGTHLADGTPNTAFTHLWLYKRRLMEDRTARESLCRRMSARLIADHPDSASALSRVPDLAGYFR